MWLSNLHLRSKSPVRALLDGILVALSIGIIISQDSVVHAALKHKGTLAVNSTTFNVFFFFNYTLSRETVRKPGFWLLPLASYIF